MTFEQLVKSVEDLQDVSAEQIADFLHAPDASTRLTARGALARSSIRRALEACGDLAREQAYGDQSTLTAIQRLVTISDWDEPYIETLKQLGIQAADKGNVNAALGYLQEAVFRGFSSGQRRDVRSRHAMRYAHDEEIDAAIERLARNFASPPFRMPPARLKLTALCTALADEDGPTVLTVKRAVYFRDEGFDVEIVSTEVGSSAGTNMAARVRALGIPFVMTPAGSWEERIRWLITYFAQHPTDVMVYMTSAQDCLAKLAACVGLAPVQSWDVRALEPETGKFDLINHGLSKDQEVNTKWPGIARCTGPGHAMAEEVAAAQPYSRAELGFPPDSILLATFGRMEKGNTPVYLEATAAILRSHPSARLLLAGPDSFNVIPVMVQYYAKYGVADRVHYLGRRQSDGPRLVKSVDLYCETYPWPGGQSLFDAMEAGRPVVAMKRSDDRDLDPTGTGATTSVADIVLTGVVPLAAPGNVKEYVSIAAAYLSDPALRARDGALLQEKVRRDCNLRAGTATYGEYLREISARKAQPA